MRTPLGPLSILVFGTTLTLAASGSASARHGGQERGTNWFADPGVMRACGDAFDGDQNELACQEAVAWAAFHPAQLVRACEQAMDGDQNELACVRLGVRARQDPSPALTPCEAEMDGDANELACFEVVAGARAPMQGAITACANAMDGDANELACIGVAAQARGDVASVITACEEAMSGDDAELECIRRGTAGHPGGGRHPRDGHRGGERPVYWGFGSGAFSPADNGQWIETGASGEVRFQFAQISQAGLDYVDLFDAGRQVYVRLTANQAYLYMPQYHTAWQPLYVGGWTR